MSYKIPEQYRIPLEKSHPLYTEKGDMFGMFTVPFEGRDILVMATDGKEMGEGWEHVSASLSNRTPNWREMCFIKDLFWDAEDCVVQYHPPQSEYINNHEHCLHLWRHPEKEMPRPPKILVGI